MFVPAGNMIEQRLARHDLRTGKEQRAHQALQIQDQRLVAAQVGDLEAVAGVAIR